MNKSTRQYLERRAMRLRVELNRYAMPTWYDADELAEHIAGLDDAGLEALLEVLDGELADLSRDAQFAETSCSQCGRAFGPGDHGYSHCKNHRVGPSDEAEKEHW